jgi:hypothetical protein
MSERLHGARDSARRAVAAVAGPTAALLVVAVVATGLLALLYPAEFGTVDQFVVKALRAIPAHV